MCQIIRRCKCRCNMERRKWPLVLPVDCHRPRYYNDAADLCRRPRSRCWRPPRRSQAHRTTRTVRNIGTTATPPRPSRHTCDCFRRYMKSSEWLHPCIFVTGPIIVKDTSNCGSRWPTSLLFRQLHPQNCVNGPDQTARETNILVRVSVWVSRSNLWTRNFSLVFDLLANITVPAGLQDKLSVSVAVLVSRLRFTVSRIWSGSWYRKFGLGFKNLSRFEGLVSLDITGIFVTGTHFQDTRWLWKCNWKSPGDVEFWRW